MNTTFLFNNLDYCRGEEIFLFSHFCRNISTRKLNGHRIKVDKISHVIRQSAWKEITQGNMGGSIYGKIEYVVLVSLELEKHIHSYISSEIQKLHGAVEIWLDISYLSPAITGNVRANPLFESWIKSTHISSTLSISR